MDRLKGAITGTWLEVPARYLVRMTRPAFHGSSRYWDDRYRAAGNSGVGSYGELAQFKARTINDFVATEQVESVIEFGCGDGNQLALSDYPMYLGVDVSREAVARCRALFASDPTKRFVTLEDFAGDRAQLTLSLDVIYHLVEDDVFDQHMRALFFSATRFVVIYSSNFDKHLAGVDHVRHRMFTRWVAENQPDFTQVRHVANEYPWDPKKSESTSWAEFYIFERNRLKHPLGAT
jgi:protein O-GlcNAc transferase